LGDPVRLAIVEALVVGDRSPAELGHHLHVGSNLLAHHLDVLDDAGMVERSRSSGDGRRRYVSLSSSAFEGLTPGCCPEAGPALFICSANTARSQLAAALWRATTGAPATSAGTDPADTVHPSAVAAAARIGLSLGDARPRSLNEIGTTPPLTVTVCDCAHEALEPGEGWLHWSIPDPVAIGTDEAFDATIVALRQRISVLAGCDLQ
jgi:protein-tyrosine-phosphatase